MVYWKWYLHKVSFQAKYTVFTEISKCSLEYTRPEGPNLDNKKFYVSATQNLLAILQIM